MPVNDQVSHVFAWGAKFSPKLVDMNVDGYTINRIFRLTRRVFRQVRKAQNTSSRPQPGRSAGNRAPRNASGYKGDYRGRLKADYAPNPNGRPDPGEIVWTWVPFEEDYSKGKDRPVLLVGRDGEELLGLMLTSIDHNNAHEHDDRYVDIGSGPWDSQSRPSEIKIDRIIKVDPNNVRREGASLDRQTFELVVSAVNSRR
ncbi:type II toxin-antitoxin system PemK/MazF family toxin [Rothia uropygioeca]|uniref:type II toxin-antitoxin system PemK/MazF family toxin n=1 Tax=Kocuria sp. 257 TaxID=2021970 RepID=UPI001EDD8681|nr:type II toxin-antitoxin system PemK/MazF family toxin [Kocuria sp. 257]